MCLEAKGPLSHTVGRNLGNQSAILKQRFFFLHIGQALRLQHSCVHSEQVAITIREYVKNIHWPVL